MDKPPSPKQVKNEEALIIYAAFLSSLILVVITIRRMREPGKSTRAAQAQDRSRQAFRDSCLQVLRKLIRRTTWKWLGQPSYGLVLLVAVYLACNVILSTTMFVAPDRLNHWASRFGWLAASNMALCVFLGLKNTPLGLVTAISHDRLSILHQITGYTAVLHLVLHASIYTTHLGVEGRLVKLLSAGDLAGIGAGMAMLVLLMAYFRHWSYETFYVSHVVGFVAAMILAYLHRPVWPKKLPYVLLFMACIWTLDRVIRTIKMSYNLINNNVTFYPLPGGATRLRLKKPGAGVAVPGSHCFLWIPRVQLYQAHPFTIVSNGPLGLELLMRTHKGFTRDVSNFAIQNPGYATLASIDGPYGCLPEVEKYDKLILVAGGSGAAFSFGLLNYVRAHRERVQELPIEFVWAVKHRDHLTWFDDHLHHLTKSETTVNATIFITNESAPVSGLGIISPTYEEAPSSIDTALLSKPDFVNYETIMVPNADERRGHVLDVNYTKMDVELVICKAMRSVRSSERVLVAACGPQLLMSALRDPLDLQRALGYNVDVHCEKFGS